MSEVRKLWLYRVRFVARKAGERRYREYFAYVEAESHEAAIRAARVDCTEYHGMTLFETEQLNAPVY